MSAIRESASFDPLADVFVAQFARPDDIGPINLRTLSAFQRALLTIDGTVTKFIEAFTMEPVDVTLLSQETRTLAADHEWLEAPKGTSVIAREVLLTGRYRGTSYAYAPSLLVVDRLPPEINAQLASAPGGLGKILASMGLETRREILWYGRERLSSIPEQVKGWKRAEVISRTYRIISGGKPLMLINEKFPLEADQAPSLD